MSTKSLPKKEVISVKTENVKTPTEVPKLISTEKESLSSKKSFFLGTSLIIIGSVILLAVVLIFLINQLPYITLGSLPVPTLNKLPNYTNKETLDISGSITKDMSITLYINGDQYTDIIESNNGKFTFSNYKFTSDNNYTFKVVAIKKTLLSFRSPYSKETTVVYDKTPPQDYIKLTDLPKETEEDEINLKGVISEAGSIIVWVKDKEYSTETDDKGKFLIENVILKKGKNDIAWRITDRAGNVIDISKLNAITRIDTGDLNGNGISTTNNLPKVELPKAAGELKRALATLSGLKMFPIFALIAIGTFILSSTAIWTWHKFTNQA